jgi:ubiquinone/menaquinone biosynthesis C-methylase UbiE
MTTFSGIKKGLQEYWNTQGSIYDFGYESDEECRYWQQVLTDSIGKEPKKILDIGTGTGFLAKNLAVLGHDVTGLDFSQDMMAQARIKMKNHHLSWNLVMGDAEHPEFPDSSFDVIICRYLLWTLPSPETAVSEWVRVVKPGGKLIVIDSKRKRVIENEPLSSRINKGLWSVSRRICRGYSGIQGHNLELEKDLPYFEGISAEEILNYYSSHALIHCTVRNLDDLPDIVARNIPWFVRFGYKSTGVLQMVSGEKPLDQEM